MSPIAPVLSVEFECAKVMDDDDLLVPVLIYENETVVWREKERPKIRAVQMDNIRGLSCIRRIDRMQNV